MIGGNRFEKDPLLTYTPSVKAAYFDFSPNNHRRGGRTSEEGEITQELIADVTPSRRRLIGLEVLSAPSHFEGIIDLSKVRRYGSDTMHARVTPEQVLQVVERMIASEEKHPGTPADFVVASIKEGIRLRDLRRNPESLVID